MKLRTLIVLIVFSVVLLPGCVRFEHPLPFEKTATADPFLNGLWYDAEESAFLHISAGETQSQHHLLTVESRPVEGYRVSHARATSSKIGNSKFLSIQPTTKDDKGDLVVDEKSGYFIYRYSADDKQLEFAGLDLKKLEALVKNGKLKGKLDYSKCPDRGKTADKQAVPCGWLNEVSISESSADLAKFFASESGKNAFDEADYLKKISVE